MFISNLTLKIMAKFLLLLTPWFILIFYLIFLGFMVAFTFQKPLSHPPFFPISLLPPPPTILHGLQSVLGFMFTTKLIGEHRVLIQPCLTCAQPPSLPGTIYTPHSVVIVIINEPTLAHDFHQFSCGVIHSM